MTKTHKSSYLFILPWTLNSLGGVNQVVENLYKQMKSDQKYDPILMVNSWDEKDIRNEKINEIEYVFLRLRNPWSAVKKTTNFMLFCLDILRIILVLNKFIRQRQVEVINYHYCSLFAFNISVLKFLGLFRGSFVLSFHGNDLINAKKSRGIEKILWIILLRSADRIITCSDFLKRELVQLYSPIIENTKTIHNGVDASFCPDDFMPKCDFLPKFEKYILNVGTLENNKGQDVLLNAFKDISLVYDDVNLVLIGRKGGMEDKLKNMIHSLGLSKRVQVYEGLSHDQVLSFMGKAMAFVFPSRKEAFGIVILEAGMCGVPVIASDVGGIPEILSHNETGILFESEDVNSLSNALDTLIRNKEERKRLGDNLKEHVKQHFSWQRTYQKYLNTIDPSCKLCE